MKSSIVKTNSFFIIEHNCLGYEYLRGLALNFTSTHQSENPQGFSEVGGNNDFVLHFTSCCVFVIYTCCCFKFTWSTKFN